MDPKSNLARAVLNPQPPVRYSWLEGRLCVLTVHVMGYLSPLPARCPVASLISTAPAHAHRVTHGLPLLGVPCLPPIVWGWG